MISYEERCIPEIQDISSPEAATEKQKEFLALLKKRLYGTMPPAPEKVSATIVNRGPVIGELAFGTKAVHHTYALKFQADKQETGFEYDFIVPNDGKEHPFFVSLGFNRAGFSNFVPTEEILDRGYGLAMFNYESVSADADVWNGIAEAYDMDRTGHDDWGKIGIWAFAASRVLDHLLTLPQVDAKRIAVIGHSRLGKTALWAGANDSRFSLVISNESGCGGAALNRGKLGETLSGMTYTFPYWFSPGMQDLRYLSADELDFDAHYLLALIAPRALLIGSADDDEWVDAYSQFCACKAASPMWEAYHETGFVCPVSEPTTGDIFHEGKLGYHLREGAHYLSRTDWNIYMDYRDKYGV